MPDASFKNAVLPEFLSGRAYVTDSGMEFALPPDAALQFLRWALEHGVKVDGFEVWRPTVPGPTSFPGAGFDGNAEACIEAVPKVQAEFGTDIVLNVWTRP